MTERPKGFVGCGAAGLRRMSVRSALEWAFAAERVSIEFDEMHDGPPDTDTIWRLMKRGLLGCKIDGGGRSLAHDDAEVIASLVARLDVAAGGRGMAVELARLARCGMAPDWMPGAVPRCLPREVVENRHGVFARTVVVDRIEVTRRGRKRKVDVMACPVHFQPSAARITSARKAYGSWWMALRCLQGPLRKAGLRTIEITQDLPPRAPWDTTA
jgi:hypothetical protein